MKFTKMLMHYITKYFLGFLIVFLSSILVAIVAAASLLTGAVGAVSLAGVSPAFRELFGITSEEQAKNLGVVQMNQVFEDKNGSGATVTVKEAAADLLGLMVRWSSATVRPS